jgi:hypothetical protein
MFVCWAELEVELLGIREVADTVVGYVHAHGVNREERLLGLPNDFQDTVELGIHRVAAAAALMVAQVRSGHALHHLVGLRKG